MREERDKRRCQRTTESINGLINTVAIISPGIGIEQGGIEREMIRLVIKIITDGDINPGPLIANIQLQHGK